MFGADRKAGRKDLEDLGRDLGFTVETVPPHMVHGERVSSTQIRHALESGNVERAAAFLGYAYQIAGTVVKGDGRGRALGYPTANLHPASPGKLIPAGGVYAVRVESGGGIRYGMMNIGIRPTVTDGSEQTVELHLFDFEGTMYGEQVRVGFLHRLREERQFASAEELLTIRDEPGVEIFYNFAVTPAITMGVDLQVINPSLGEDTVIIPGLRWVTRF